MLHGTGIFTYICKKKQSNVGKYIIYKQETYGTILELFFCIDLFADCIMVSHHFSPPTGIIRLELFPSIEESQIQDIQ